MGADAGPAMRSKRAGSPIVVAVAGLAALAVAMGIGRFAFTPVLPMMQVDAGLSVAAGGWLAVANYVGSLLGALAAMALRVAAPTAIRGGLVTIGLATLAMGLEQPLAGWIVLRLWAGMATAWVCVFASAWSLERLAPLQRPVLHSTVFAGYGVGIAAAGVVCLGLMHVQASSAHAWVSLGGLALVVTAVIWPIFGVDHNAASDVDHRVTDYGHRWDTASVRLVVRYGAFGFGYIIPATFLPVMARQVVQDAAIFGWAWPLFGLAAAGSTFAAAGFARRAGNRRLWSRGHIVMALGVVLPVFWPGIVAIMLSALLVGGTFTVITMAGFQAGWQVAGVHAREMIAAMASAFAIGQIVGSAGVSYLVREGGGFSEALVVACLLLTASAWVLTSRRAYPQGDMHEPSSSQAR
jgi:predicted MFS family arabinose efflux permease